MVSDDDLAFDVDEAGASQPDDDFRYNATLGAYKFNLQLGYPTGTYKLNFVANAGGALYEAPFPPLTAREQATYRVWLHLETSVGSVDSPAVVMRSAMGAEGYGRVDLSGLGAARRRPMSARFGTQ